MWILALEALAALCMLVLIVWLTMGKPRRRDAEASKKSSTADASDDSKRP